MSYIYKITNDINQKIYIGKTKFSIEKRFKEHCNDAFKRTNEKRPLYSAMRKYGIEHFHIEEIEKTDKPEEKEIYWIEYYNSFKNGYNATLGGDGKRYLDYDLIVETYNKFKSISDTAKELNIDEIYAGKILKSKNVNILSSQDVMSQKYGKAVNMYDLNDNFIQKFDS